MKAITLALVLTLIGCTIDQQKGYLPSGSSAQQSDEEPNQPLQICSPAEQPLQELSLARTIHLNAAISDFAITSQVSSVSFGENLICMDHSKMGVWPAPQALEGNFWMVARHSGKWFIFSYGGYRRGERCKSIRFDHLGENSGVDGANTSVTNWNPCPGAWVGFFATTPTRSGKIGTALERTDVRWLQWAANI